MNCPCSEVYVCAYIVIFLPRPTEESGLFYVSFSLCPLRQDPRLSSKSKRGEHKTAHNQAACFTLINV